MHVIQLPNVQRSKLMNKIPFHFRWGASFRPGSISRSPTNWQMGGEIISFYVNDTN